eukprot:5024529-Pleurochrysis_carterae.AAC.1
MLVRAWAHPVRAHLRHGTFAAEPPPRTGRVRARLLGKDEELESVVEVAGLSMDRYPWVLRARQIDETRVTHHHHRLLALEVAPVVAEVDRHLGPLVVQLQRRLRARRQNGA